MSANAVGTERVSCVGRWCVVGWKAPRPDPERQKPYLATVVDFVPGEPDEPKRVRIQKDLLYQGKVLQPSEYEFYHFVEDEED